MIDFKAELESYLQKNLRSYEVSNDISFCSIQSFAPFTSSVLKSQNIKFPCGRGFASRVRHHYKPHLKTLFWIHCYDGLVPLISIRAAKLLSL